ncbi:MAG TPA: ABC transporter substrate-binding protein [Coleofasciculaceae cyanobacterium]|jgi:hypothetical protein
MVISLNKNSTNKGINLNSSRVNAIGLKITCSDCGGFHPTDEHWKFMQDMPQDPVDMISDLAKMGIYKPEAFKMANAVNAADLRKTLLLKMAGKGDPKRERLVLELCKQAGGMNNAFAASDDWISANPNTFRSLNKAIIEAAGYAQDPANRPKIAKAISERAFLNQPVEVVEAVLTGNFEDGLGNTKSIPDRIDFDPYPWQALLTGYLLS